jgi:hypothetical protein
MATQEESTASRPRYPVSVWIDPAMQGRNRLTTFFRFFLAIPHLLLVGAPVATVTSISYSTEAGSRVEIGSGGLLSAVVAIALVFAWIAIVVTARHPQALWRLARWYLRWRVRAIAYFTLLRDEYPPFGEGPYPAGLDVEPPAGPRNRLTVFFRIILALPHLVLLGLLGVVWSFTTALAWVFILVTGDYPETLYGFGIGVLAWTTRVEAYTLLLTDAYPPFTLRA